MVETNAAVLLVIVEAGATMGVVGDGGPGGVGRAWKPLGDGIVAAVIFPPCCPFCKSACNLLKKVRALGFVDAIWRRVLLYRIFNSEREGVGFGGLT